MKPMMAKAKTLADLTNDIMSALDAYVTAARAGYGALRSANSLARIDARKGHLWAQYENAHKLRNRAMLAGVR